MHKGGIPILVYTQNGAEFRRFLDAMATEFSFFAHRWLQVLSHQ